MATLLTELENPASICVEFAHYRIVDTLDSKILSLLRKNLLIYFKIHAVRRVKWRYF